MSAISSKLREKISQEAGNRCGYCLGQQNLVLGVLEIDHITPIATGGGDNEENLWLACRAFNTAKGKQIDAIDPLGGRRVPLFNPRIENWWDHFCWSDTGLQIIGITPIGRATVVALNLNNTISLMVRRNWVKAGWHPPKK